MVLLDGFHERFGRFGCTGNGVLGGLSSFTSGISLGIGSFLNSAELIQALLEFRVLECIIFTT